MTEMKILILEDELTLAYTLSAALEKNMGAGCMVKICSTAEVALQMLKLHKFDLIISDWHLPGISGLEFITEVRSSLPDVPIIFMTAFGTEELEEKIHSLSNHYIKKPFDIPDLTQTIDKLLTPKNGNANESPVPNTDKSRIFILEDDLSLLNLYRKVFKKHGHLVRTAQNLPDANNILGQEDFDLFICDVRIDKSYGVDLLLIWRDKLLKNNTKVVVVSGDPWYRVMSEKIGADHFFRKPIEMSVLIDLANNLSVAHQ